MSMQNDDDEHLKEAGITSASSSLFACRGGLQYVVPYLVPVTYHVAQHGLSREEQRKFQNISLRTFFETSRKFSHLGGTTFLENALKRDRVRIIAAAPKRQDRNNNNNNNNNNKCADEQRQQDQQQQSAKEVSIVPQQLNADDAVLNCNDKVVILQHYHEPPVIIPKLSSSSVLLLLNSSSATAAAVATAPLRIQIVDFVPSESLSQLFTSPTEPATSAGSTAMRVKDNNSSCGIGGGIVVLNKPSSVPVHASGKYHKNTLQHYLRLGLFDVMCEKVARKILASLSPMLLLLPSASGEQRAMATKDDDNNSSSLVRKAEDVLRRTVFHDQKVHFAHRLDKGTSGCLLVATSQCARVVNDLLAEKTELGSSMLVASSASSSCLPAAAAAAAPVRIEKTYLARVVGRLEIGGDGATSSSSFKLFQRAIYAVGAAEFACLTEAEQKVWEAKQQQQDRDSCGVEQNDDHAADADDDGAGDASNQQSLRATSADTKTRSRDPRLSAPKWAATLLRTVKIIPVAASPSPSAVALGGEASTDNSNEMRHYETIVECQPISGRTHQLRVHLAALGHPIVGDDFYSLKQHNPAMMNSITGAVGAAATKDSSASASSFSSSSSSSFMSQHSFASSSAAAFVAGRDFEADEQCLECAQCDTEGKALRKFSEAFSYSCPLLCLHAMRYKFVSAGVGGESISVEATMPDWV